MKILSFKEIDKNEIYIYILKSDENFNYNNGSGVGYFYGILGF